MSEVAFVLQEALIDGSILMAGPLGSGDSTGVLTINEGNADVALQIWGSVGGATVDVLGSLVDGQFSAVDDAYGSVMRYTTVGFVKPLGPGVQSLKVTVTGGVGVSVFVGVYIVKGRR